MRRLAVTGFLCFCTAVIFVPIHSNAVSLECDSVQCWPDPGSSGYANVARARTIPQNSRGSDGAFGAEAGPGGTENNLGSQSYNYAIPILRLPGRNGLNLTLHYNSRIWQIERSGVGTASLNSDRDFPSYGFRLDFGFLEYNDTDNVFILTEADGSKRRLVASGSIYVSDDSSFIDYDSTSKILRYKNGLQVHYTQFTTTGYVNFFNPTKIRDTNGNRITITYNSSDRINTITDTLGRVITYNYTDGRLTTITQALTPSGSKTWATFDWNTSLALTYNFTAGGFFVLAPGNTTGSSIQPETGSVIKVLTKCTYANGTGYRFTYGGWGIVNKIENLSASNPQEVRSSIEYNFPSGSTSHSDAPAFTEQNHL